MTQFNVYHFKSLERDEVTKSQEDAQFHLRCRPDTAIFSDIAIAVFNVGTVSDKFGGMYRLVAQVEVDDALYPSEISKLEYVFMMTNSINNVWYNNPLLKAFEKAASSSVGDVFECGGTFFLIATVGYKKLPPLVLVS